jgi:hypothetical protein
LATFRDLRTYVSNDGWTEEANLARGRRRIGDHRRYFRDLPDGTRLRTKVSHDERAEIGPDLFRRILRDQLRVTEDQFWAVVRGRASADAEPTTEAEPIPGWLVTRLIFTMGLSEKNVARMTVEEAQAAWMEYQTRPEGGDAASGEQLDGHD